MADEDDDKKSEILDVAGAVLLGVTTALAAYGAYQSSLYGGNQATAYTEAINTLGEANRELLRGVNERTFDTTVWIEHMKATQPAPEPPPAPAGVEGEAAGAVPGAVPAAAAPAAPAAAEEEEEEKPLTKDEAAKELAEELTSVEDLTLAKKMDKLLQTRRELVAALKWADQEHEKTTKKMPKEKRLELAKVLVDLDEKMEKAYEAQYAILEKLEVAEGEDAEIEEALAKNPDAKAQMAKLEEEIAAHDKEAEKTLDKLAKPLFFESTQYSKNQERAYVELLEKGNKKFEEGGKANEIGDKFTLATVFYTVALFFAGLSPVMRRFPIKAAFFGMATAIAIAATVYMFKNPII